MESYLFNIVQKVLQIKEVLVAKGPLSLRQAGDVLSYLVDLVRGQDSYASLNGSLVAFNFANHADQPPELAVSAVAKEHINVVSKAKKEFETELAATESQVGPHAQQIEKQISVGVREGAVDWSGKACPPMKSDLLRLTISVLSKVEIKSGKFQTEKPDTKKKS